MLAEYRQTTGYKPVPQPMLAEYRQTTGWKPNGIKP